MLPFTRSEFFSVFARYNESVWPAQVFLYVLALAAIVLAFRRTREASRGVHAILAILWIWMGAVYHAGFFAEINPLAPAIAVVFLLQGVLFIWLSARKSPVVVSPEYNVSGWIGGGLVVLGLMIAVTRIQPIRHLSRATDRRTWDPA